MELPLLAAVRLAAVVFAAVLLTGSQAADAPAKVWKIGTPVVAYWGGPGYPGAIPMSDAAASKLAAGGWNEAWCSEKDLDVAQRHKLRGLLIEPRLLDPSALDDPQKRAELDALILRVKKHPAMYAYHLTDEPGAARFPALGKLVAYLRERDPAHLAYINVFPIYANNAQLGTKGDTVEAYAEHLRQYVEVVRPGLLSYDHYQFTNGGDNPQYFLNLAMIREQSLAAGVPFMNIVQASSWVPGSAASPSAPRVPNGDEMRYLVYTTVAYGAQGISYYVYYYPQHEGGIVLADGTPTPLYDALKTLNREFVAIARELQPLKSLGVFHAGMQPPGTKPVPPDSPFILDPPVPDMHYNAGERVQGVLLGQFGASGKASSPATHVLVVNLDYKAERTVSLRGTGALEVFDATNGHWSPLGGARAELRLAGGGGKLLRVRPGRRR
jgi:hypothetical protein